MGLLANALEDATTAKVKLTSTFYELLDVLDEVLVKPPTERSAKRRRVVLLNLPTGYGKTRISIVMGKVASDGLTDSFLRVIHVIPTRNLAEDILRHARELGINASAQYMFADPSLKAPYFLAPFLVTTLDSYSYNFLKIPVAETRYVASRGLGHSEIPRHAIYTALNFIDEYHVFLSSEVGLAERIKCSDLLGKATTFLYFMILHLVGNSITDVVLSTATPVVTPEFLKQKLGLGDDAIFAINYDLSSKPGITHEGSTVKVNDREFNEDRFLKNVVTRVKKLSIEDIADECVKSLNTGRKCLIVLNKVDRVIKVYELVRSAAPHASTVVIVHSRFRVKERKLISEKVGEVSERGGAVIASPAIEVGVDFDSDVLVSDAAPLPSLVQRCGRLLRSLGDGEREGEFTIVYDDELASEELGTYSGIYPLDLTKGSVESVKEVLQDGKFIDWKLAFNGVLDGRVSYVSLLKSIQLTDYIDKLISARYLSLLNAITSLMTTPREVRSVMDLVSSFVRYYPIVPAFIPDEDVDASNLRYVVDSYAKNYAEYLLPMELSTRRLTALSDALVRSNGGAAVLVEDSEGCLDYLLVSESRITDVFTKGAVVRSDGLYLPVALVVSPKYYSPEVGLRVG